MQRIGFSSNVSAFRQTNRPFVQFERSAFSTLNDLPMKKSTITWTEYSRNHFKMKSCASSRKTLAIDFKAVGLKALELLSQEKTKTNIEVTFFVDSRQSGYLR
jgi:hypothetical protein